jgi:hypothetical protein
MKCIKRSAVMLLMTLLVILVASCTTPTTAPAPSPTPSTVTSPSTPTATDSPTPRLSPTASPVPSPSLTPTQTPIVSPTPNPAEDKNYYLDKIITGYNRTLKSDGTYEETPIYQDMYFDLNILGYYTKKDAVLVPRIPTFTDHDDWFIRFKIPSFLLKPWIMNWGYSINKFSPAAGSVTLSTSVYTQEMFNTNYYLRPDKLLAFDLKGDREPSSSGIYCKSFQTPGDYVILLRTNAADAIDDFWIKLGTEGSIVTPTP